MKILSHSEYKKAIVRQTFAKKEKLKYDTGKYKNNMKGRELSDISPDVIVVWSERRKDKHGPYFQLFCHLKGQD